METQQRGYTPKDALVAARIAGGFTPVRADELLAAWDAYVSSTIELRDLRLWFAGLELRSARTAGRMGAATAGAGELLRELTGSKRAASRLISRLSRVECLVQQRRGQGRIDDGCFRNLRRRVPAPRRLMRFLATRGSRASIAAAVGHLLRCMYWRGPACVSGGTAKASELAASLGVSLRSIRRGRRELIQAGWLERVETSQHVLNRHGAVMRVRSGVGVARCGLTPPRPDFGRGLAPPKNRNQLRCHSRTRTEDRSLFDPSRQRERLRDRGFMEHEFARWVRTGAAIPSEAERLAVHACAEYAARVGTRSPMGLFGYLVRGRLWDRPTLADEDAARAVVSGQRPPSELERVRAFLALEATWEVRLLGQGHPSGHPSTPGFRLPSATVTVGLAHEWPGGEGRGRRDSPHPTCRIDPSRRALETIRLTAVFLGYPARFAQDQSYRVSTRYPRPRPEHW